ncbi:glutathione S-transferase family protein [Dongia sp.]|uniref:glutathione S-transferase family protein n=1 Tax=Dongia sp. TaxID=1977262 RepID=UPI0035B440DB
MLTLYYSPQSCALASHIALQEAGATYDAARLDFSREEQRQAAYLKINPKGRVPALATDRGILTETPAILFYIAQTYPQARLAPLDDAFALGRIQAFNSYLCSTVHVAHAHRMRAYRWADDAAAQAEMKRKATQNVADCFALIESEMFTGPYVMGDAYTVADPYLYTLATWLEGDGVDPARFPKILAHRDRMAARPAVKAVTALHN